MCIGNRDASLPTSAPRPPADSADTLYLPSFPLSLPESIDGPDSVLGTITALHQSFILHISDIFAPSPSKRSRTSLRPSICYTRPAGQPAASRRRHCITHPENGVLQLQAQFCLASSRPGRLPLPQWLPPAHGLDVRRHDGHGTQHGRFSSEPPMVLLPTSGQQPGMQLGPPPAPPTTVPGAPDGRAHRRQRVPRREGDEEAELRRQRLGQQQRQRRRVVDRLAKHGRGVWCQDAKARPAGRHGRRDVTRRPARGDSFVFRNGAFGVT